MWGVGCIFAEMLTNKTLFNSDSNDEHLELIYTLLGSPTINDLNAMNNEID